MVPLSYKELVMLLSKEEVQQRVLYTGKYIPMDKFTWDSDSCTFSSVLDDLVIDFNYIDDITFKTGANCTFNTGGNCTFKTEYGCTFTTSYDCTFKTKYDCTFKTGHGCVFDTDGGCTFKTGFKCMFTTRNSCIFKTGYGCTFNTDNYCTFNTNWNCTFDTGSYCTFTTGDECTFDTGSYCTFTTGDECTFNTGDKCTIKTDDSCTFNTGDKCVIINRDAFENIPVNKDTGTITLCPYAIPGYLIGSTHYLDNVPQDGKYIIADNILSKIINQKGDVYKVINHGSTEVTYLVKSGELWSHGDTLAEARESLIYKISSRDTSKYDNHTLDTVISKTEAIQMYRTITGACESGVRDYVKSLDEVPFELTISELIELTTGKYGNDVLSKFFNK